MVFSGTFPAEKRTLLVARNTAGYFVSLPKPGQPSLGPKPYRAPLTSEEARQQAQAEGLTLIKAENKTGYFGVCLSNPGKPKPYKAQVSRGGKNVHLGSFATAEEAALCGARSREGKIAAAAAPLTSEEARQQAQAEGLTLRVGESKTGYYGVAHRPGRPKPYQAEVKRGGKTVHLGCFATAEEAALCVAHKTDISDRLLQEQLARLRSSWNHESQAGAEEVALCVARYVGQAAAAQMQQQQQQFMTLQLQRLQQGQQVQALQAQQVQAQVRQVHSQQFAAGFAAYMQQHAQVQAQVQAQAQAQAKNTAQLLAAVKLYCPFIATAPPAPLLNTSAAPAATLGGLVSAPSPGAKKRAREGSWSARFLTPV